jgi:hypothetical protein
MQIPGSLGCVEINGVDAVSLVLERKIDDVALFDPDHRTGKGIIESPGFTLVVFRYLNLRDARSQVDGNLTRVTRLRTEESHRGQRQKGGG